MTLAPASAGDFLCAEAQRWQALQRVILGRGPFHTLRCRFAYRRARRKRGISFCRRRRSRFHSRNNERGMSAQR
jgi:hypothetical protein